MSGSRIDVSNLKSYLTLTHMILLTARFGCVALHAPYDPFAVGLRKSSHARDPHVGLPSLPPQEALRRLKPSHKTQALRAREAPVCLSCLDMCIHVYVLLTYLHICIYMNR